MFNTDTDLLFPLRVISQLGDLRGPEWKKLIERLSDEQTDVSEKIAFTSMVVKLAGCSACNADSFRAMRGCTQCSRMILKRFKGNDVELLKNYHECQQEVNIYLQKRDQ
jgi:hypothetical protein